MATKSATLRSIISFLADLGEEPSTEEDLSFTIDGFAAKSITDKKLSNTADSEVFNLLGSDLCGLIVVSRDYPFGLEFAVGETQMTNGMIYVWWGDDDDEAAYPNSSILLTGNTANDSNLIIFQIQANP